MIANDFTPLSFYLRDLRKKPCAPSVVKANCSTLSRLPVSSGFQGKLLRLTLPERFRGSYAFGGAMFNLFLARSPA